MVPKFDQELVFGRPGFMRAMKPYSHAFPEEDVGISGFDLHQTAVGAGCPNRFADKKVGIFLWLSVIPGQFVRGVSDRYIGDALPANCLMDLLRDG